MSREYDEETLRRAADVFRDFGFTDNVFLIEATSPGDEIMFGVPSAAAANLPEARLVQALMDALGMKVFITTSWDASGARAEPLAFDRRAAAP